MTMKMTPIIELELALRHLPVRQVLGTDAVRIVTDDQREQTVLRASLEDDARGTWYVTWPNEPDRDAVVDSAGVAELVREELE